MHAIRTVLCLLFLTALLNCGVHKKGRVSLGSGVSVEPASLKDIATAQSYVQVFEITRNGTPFRFNGHVELEQERLAMVGLTPVGSRGFSATWDGGVFTYEHLPFYRLPISPEMLLNLWQMAFLEEASLQPILQEAQLTMEPVPQDGRKFLYKDHLLVTVSKEDQKTLITHHLRGFTLKIDTKAIEIW